MSAALGVKVARGAAWSALETWSRHMFNFAIVVALARQLGPEDFGLAALAMVPPTVLSVPVIYGMPEALVQRRDLEPIHVNSSFWLLVGVGALNTLLIWLTAGPIASMLGEPRLADILRWTSVIVILYALGSVPSAMLKRELEFRVFALRTTVGTAAGGMLGILLAINGHGVWSLVFMQIARIATESAILLGFGNWRPKLEFSFVRCRDLFGFSGPLIVQQLWNYLNDELPKVIMGFIIGTQAVGVYAFARRPYDFLSQCFLGPVASVIMPAVSRMQANPTKVDAFFALASRMVALVGFPVFIGFIAIAPEAVPLVFGAQWSEAVPAVQLMMLLGLVRIFDVLPALALLALGYSRVLLWMNIPYTGLCLLLVTAGSRLGLEAAIVGIVVCNVVLVPVFLYLAKRIGGIDVLGATASLPRLAFCSILMVGAIEVVRIVVPFGGAPTLLLAQIAAGGLIFLLSVALLLPGELRAATDLAQRIWR